MTADLWQIAFIFLGPKLPRYARASLERCRTDFPGHRIILGTDLGNAPKIPGVEVFRVSPGALSHEHYSGFRSGFWLKSIQRLVVLEQVHEQYPRAPLLHVEADVRLAPYFDFSMLPTQKLGWGQVTHLEDGAALLSSPDFSQTRWLAEELKKQVKLNPGITDMPALSNIRMAFPSRVSLMPTSSQINRGEPAKVIDFAAIGMWTAGTDPRNSAGMSRVKLPQPQHDLDLGKNTVCLDVDQGQVLLVNAQGGVSQVQNLHLHAKQTLFFTLGWRELLDYLANFAGARRFYPGALIMWLMDRAGEYIRLGIGLLKKLSPGK